MLVTSALISGLGLGSMYGLLALGFHITYSVSNTVNFSQGSSMMLGAVFAYAFAVGLGWPLAAAAAASLVLCGLYGIIVEFVAIRPFTRRGSNSWLMATVAIGIVADNIVLFTFGKEPRGFPMPASFTSAGESVQLFGVGVSPLQLAIPVAGLAMAGLLHAFTRRTRLGKALLAVVQNRDAAHLMGINVGAAHRLAFGLGTALAGIAGGLLVLYYPAQPFVGSDFLIIMYAGVVLGGLGSIVGSFWGGFVIALVQQLSTLVLPLQLQNATIFVGFLLLLLLRPQGLFGRSVDRA